MDRTKKTQLTATTKYVKQYQNIRFKRCLRIKNGEMCVFVAFSCLPLQNRCLNKQQKANKQQDCEQPEGFWTSLQKQKSFCFLRTHSSAHSLTTERPSCALEALFKALLPHRHSKQSLLFSRVRMQNHFLLH